VGVDVVGFDGQRGSVRRYGLLGTAQHVQRGAEAIARLGVCGITCQKALEVRNSVLRSIELQQGFAERDTRFGGASACSNCDAVSCRRLSPAEMLPRFLRASI
jgi:hypothetical protein